MTGLGFWTPGFPSPQAWIAGRRDPAATKPPCSLLNSRIGRYTSLVTRMAVEALQQAGAQGRADLGRVATVFGSAYGEIRTAFDQLDMIELEGVPSPARFKNSVHNTASGHVSISTGNTGFSTALCAGRATFAMSLLEAWVWLEEHEGAVIVAVAEEPLPDHLATVARYAPLGIALHLRSRQPPEGTLGRLSSLRRSPETAPAPDLPRDLSQNPCAAGLPLLEAILRGEAGRVPVELGGEGWSVDLSASRGVAS